MAEIVDGDVSTFLVSSCGGSVDASVSSGVNSTRIQKNQAELCVLVEGLLQKENLNYDNIKVQPPSKEVEQHQVLERLVEDMKLFERAADRSGVARSDSIQLPEGKSFTGTKSPSEIFSKSSTADYFPDFRNTSTAMCASISEITGSLQHEAVGEQEINSDTQTVQECGHTLYVHALKLTDPRVGGVVVCPLTLEIMCLKKMLHAPVKVIWEELATPVGPNESGGEIWSWLGLGNCRGLPLSVVTKNRALLLSRNFLVEEIRRRCHTDAVEGRSRDGKQSISCENLADDNDSCLGDVNAESSARDDGDFLVFSTADTQDLAMAHQATVAAAEALLEHGVHNALNYYLWKDLETYENFTRPLHINSMGMFYGRYYSWRMKQMWHQGWGGQNLPEMPLDGPLLRCSDGHSDASEKREKDCEIMENIRTLPGEEVVVLNDLRVNLRLLDYILSGRRYLGGTKPSALDARVFSYLAVLFSIPLADRLELQNILTAYPSLVEYCKRIQDAYHPWPGRHSFLFGHRTLADTTDSKLTLHSWRRNVVNRCSSTCGGDGGRSMFIRWSVISSVCIVGFIALGFTPFRLLKRT